MSCPPANGSGKSVSSSLPDTSANGLSDGIRFDGTTEATGDSSFLFQIHTPAAAGPAATAVDAKKPLRVIPRRVTTATFATDISRMDSHSTLDKAGNPET